MRFSERMGHRPVKTAIQVDSMDPDLRASLWNVFRPAFIDILRSSLEGARRAARRAIRLIWDEHFKLPAEDAPTTVGEAALKFRHLFLKNTYLDVYDLIDFAVQRFGAHKPRLEVDFNRVLEREVSGYRFVGGMLSPITNEYELQTIEKALGLGGTLSGAARHLGSALKLLSDRESPDYRNSVKESISAVESAARAITGKPKATLGALLSVLETTGHIHPAQKEAFSKLYGYASDEDGIRHAMLDDATVDFGDAKYMLAVCAAFIAYLAARTP